MESFRKLFATVSAVIIAVFICANLILASAYKNDPASRPYRVEAERMAAEVQNGSLTEESLHNCKYITGVERLSKQNANSFYNSNSDYLIREINGGVYRFDYICRPENNFPAVVTNVCLTVAAIASVILLLVIREKIIKPFDRIREVPFELAKGNLSLPLKADKSRYFGRFLWGLDLLREKLEQQKSRELELQKQKNTLLLSLSHDIKTPLSIIGLYARALDRGLYADEIKTRQVAQGINNKCVEISDYVSRIVAASSDDFLNLDVTNGEFYLSQVIDPINAMYSDKLELLKIDFKLVNFPECILKGDSDRAVEVLQNIIENAVKYGGGSAIDISFGEEDECILISVTNGGCTLSENELPHIFDSFWRGSNVGSTAGSGLGLYICRQLMRKMNGEVFARIDGGTITLTAVFCKAQ